MTRGKFITLEGMDGAGKSTHLSWIPGFLVARGVKVRLTREPGGTPLGEEIRKLLLEWPGDKKTDRTELLLFAAARAEHVDAVGEQRRGDGVARQRLHVASVEGERERAAVICHACRELPAEEIAERILGRAS